eukprot:IDg6883t1
MRTSVHYQRADWQLRSRYIPTSSRSPTALLRHLLVASLIIALEPPRELLPSDQLQIKLLWPGSRQKQLYPLLPAKVLPERVLIPSEGSAGFTAKLPLPEPCTEPVA